MTSGIRGVQGPFGPIPAEIFQSIRRGESRELAMVKLRQPDRSPRPYDVGLARIRTPKSGRNRSRFGVDSEPALERLKEWVSACGSVI